jgi:hypothetical protein
MQYAKTTILLNFFIDILGHCSQNILAASCY